MGTKSKWRKIKIPIKRRRGRPLVSKGEDQNKEVTRVWPWQTEPKPNRKMTLTEIKAKELSLNKRGGKTAAM